MSKIRFKNNVEIEIVPRQISLFQMHTVSKAGLYNIEGIGSSVNAYYDSKRWLNEGSDFDIIDESNKWNTKENM